MKETRLAEFLRHPANFLPPPEEGLKVTYGGSLFFYISSSKPQGKGDKLNELANLVVAKLEPKIRNPKNFEVSTLVSAPYVLCDKCGKEASGRYVMETHTGEKSVRYWCEFCKKAAQKHKGIKKVTESYDEKQSGATQSV